MKSIFDSVSTDLKKKFQDIKLLILDFDGTLTDNMVYTDQDGKEMVRTSRSDSLGLENLRKNTNVEVIIISKEKNPVTMARANKLNILCIKGIDNKIIILNNELKKRGIRKEYICFIGNDINDIECINEAGIGVAVADAYPQVLKIADYITRKNGGYGAVREICDIIMYAKGVFK
jgi:YrbI family 3-deoxy-D-manno-octulosonate 8-phosphate phosphatase